MALVSRWRRPLRLVLLIVAAVFWATLLARLGGQLLAQRWQLEPLALLGAAGSYALALLGAGLAWHLLVAALGSQLGLLGDARLLCIALAARRLPGGIWGHASRVLAYQAAALPPPLTLLGMALEAGLVLLSGLALAAGLGLLLLGLPLGFVALPPLAGAALAHLALRRGLLHLLARGLGGRLAALRALEAVSPPRLATAALLGYLVYLAVWLLGGGALGLVLMGLGGPAPAASDLLFAWTLASSLDLLLYVLPSEAGVREAGLLGLLGRAVPPAFALGAAVGLRLLAMLLEVAATLALTWLARKRR